MSKRKRQATNAAKESLLAIAIPLMTWSLQRFVQGELYAGGAGVCIAVILLALRSYAESRWLADILTEYDKSDYEDAAEDIGEAAEDVMNKKNNRK